MCLDFSGPGRLLVIVSKKIAASQKSSPPNCKQKKLLHTTVDKDVQLSAGTSECSKKAAAH